MQQEYESLRSEILQWQEGRFRLIEVSASLVTAIVGLDIVLKPSAPEHWALVSAVLLAFLSSAGLLTWYAGRANSKLATYLKVFHEETSSQTLGWEARLGMLKDKGADPYNVNHWIAVIYLVLAVVSVLIPYVASSFQTPIGWSLTLLIVSACLFLGSLVLVAVFSYPRKSYEDHWREVQREERNKPGSDSN